MSEARRVERAFELAALLGYGFLIFGPPAAAGAAPAGSSFWQSAKYAGATAIAAVLYLVVVFTLGRWYHSRRR